MQKFALLRDYHSRDIHKEQYCELLDSYNHCMKGLNKSCRGKLEYHAVIAHVRKWLIDYNCTSSETNSNNNRQQQIKSTVSLRQQIEARRQELLLAARQTDSPEVDQQEEGDYHQSPTHNPVDGKRIRKCKKSRSTSHSLTSASRSHFSNNSNILPWTVSLILLIFSIRCH
jgi:hypothetical protein